MATCLTHEVTRVRFYHQPDLFARRKIERAHRAGRYMHGEIGAGLHLRGNDGTARFERLDDARQNISRAEGARLFPSQKNISRANGDLNELARGGAGERNFKLALSARNLDDGYAVGR